MAINFKLKTDLLERGFVVTHEGSQRMEYAMGSIAHYNKCTITLGHRVFGDIANQWFYWVRLESFAESGQPEFDHHTIREQYVAESAIPEFMRDNAILTRAELEDRRAEWRARMRRG